MKRLFIITIVVTGILLSLQIRSFKSVQPLVARLRSGDVLLELRTYQIANEQLRRELFEKEKRLGELTTNIASASVEEEIERLRLRAGYESVVGEGIEITVASSVEEFWLNDLITVLTSNGAEAIAINDVRITPESAGLRTVGNGIILGKDFLESPLRITAIGPSKNLSQAISQGGGIVDRIQRAHPENALIVAVREQVAIPALPQD